MKKRSNVNRAQEAKRAVEKPRSDGYRCTHRIDCEWLAHVTVTSPSGKTAETSCHSKDIKPTQEKLVKLLRRDEPGERKVAPAESKDAPASSTPVQAATSGRRRSTGSRSYHSRPLPTKGVGAFIIEQLRAGKDAAAIVKGIRKQFPESKSTEKDVAWYRRRLENGK